MPTTPASTSTDPAADVGSPALPPDPSTALPILDEVPVLGAAIELARRVDRTVAQLIDALLELEDHDVAELATGVALEQWMAIAGRRTSSDRRMLFTTCDVLRRLPSLRSAFCDEGSVSWAQVRTVVLEVYRLPRALDDLIDGELARTIDACRDADPDMLTQAVSRAARSWDPAPTSEAQEVADREEFVAMQPRLDGSGGQLFGELGALSFATVDAALTPTRRPDATSVADAAGTDDGGRFRRGRLGRERARRLVALCDAGLDGGSAPEGDGAADVDPAAGGGAEASDLAGSRPQLLVRVGLDTLLDREATPAELLTKLTGGKLWIDAATARRLADERGADLRTVVLDDCGRIVGVGRRSRIAPGWLADATLALHDTCSRPECRAPARRCQTDHAAPWHPPARDQRPGRTDIDQLAPLCEHHNRTKETSGWRVTQAADGTRRWYHPRTGLATTTYPATWQPVPPRVNDRNSEDLDRDPDVACERPPPYDAAWNGSEVRDAGPAPPGRDTGRAPPGRDGGRAPPGWDGGRAPPGRDSGRAPPGWDGGRAPPGRDGGRAPAGWDGGRAPPARARGGPDPTTRRHQAVPRRYPVVAR